MKIPNKLMIGNSEYIIGVSDILNSSIAGGCHHEQKMILISSKQNQDEAIATLFHEILHAIEGECKLTLGHKRINRMEYALAQVFIQLLEHQKRKRK